MLLHLAAFSFESRFSLGAHFLIGMASRAAPGYLRSSGQTAK
jgi:hypothetical protein